MLLLLAACAPDPDDSGVEIDDVTFLTEPGPWSVGHLPAEVTYTDAEGGPRSLRTSIWYPSRDTSGFPAQYLLGLTRAEGVYEGAEPVKDEDFPVIAYSHGHRGYAEASSFLTEHFASHGYLVVAPDHTGDTTFDDPDRRTDIYFDRPADLRVTLDALDAGALVEGVRPDGDVVAVGHSFGGYTAFPAAGVAWDVPGITAACAADDSAGVCADWAADMDGDGEADWPERFAAGGGDARVRALVAMAPGDHDLLGAANLGAIEVPALLMTGEFDPERTADGAAYWADLAPTGARYLDVIGGAHNTFADVAGAMNDGQTLDPEEGHRLVRAYALAFAEQALGRGDHTAVLDGDERISDAESLP
jgi:predicted dienelactone hydrolase